MIEWDPVEVLTCLESEPAVDEDRTSYSYTLSRDGFELMLDVGPYHGDVWLRIRQVGQADPMIDLRMEGCREIRYIRDNVHEALYFVSFDERSEYPVNIRGGWSLQVKPHIAVKLSHPSA